MMFIGSCAANECFFANPAEWPALKGRASGPTAENPGHLAQTGMLTGRRWWGKALKNQMVHHALLGRATQPPRDSSIRGMMMKSRWLAVVAVLFSGFVFLLLLRAFLRQAYDQILDANTNRAEVASEIGDIYVAYCRAHKIPPLGLQDLEPYAPLYPRALSEMKTGGWVVLWGTPVVLVQPEMEESGV